MTGILRLIVSAIAICLFVSPIAAQTSPPTAPRGPLVELACPQQSQILVLLQSASAPVIVTVDAVPGTGNATAPRLDAKTVAPQDMPATLEFSQVIGEKDVFVFVRDAARGGTDPKAVPDALDGYIGCGEWQARLAVGEPNAFLLKRTPQRVPQIASMPSTSAPAAGNPAAEGVTPAPPAAPVQSPLSGPRLGVVVQNLNDEIRGKNDIPRGVSGVLVSVVHNNSSAEAAKIAVGEIITSIDGEAVWNGKQLAEEVAYASKKGSAFVTLRVVNSRGRTRTVQVLQAANAPAMPEPSAPTTLTPLRYATDFAIGLRVQSGGQDTEALGVKVAWVEDKGLAAEAGILVGDRIVAVAGHSIAATREFADELERLRKEGNPTVILGVMTGATQRSVAVSLPQLRKVIGLTVQPIDDDVRRKDGIPPGVNGVIVRRVISNTPVEAAKIAVGNIVTSLNDRAVTGVEQFTMELKRASEEGDAWVTLQVVDAHGQTRTARLAFWFNRMRADSLERDHPTFQ